MKYPVVCIAGTFDGIHKGHEKLLVAAFSHGNHVVIALTSDKFVKKYKTASPFESRRKALIGWLQKKNYANYEIFSLDDPIGPAATAEYNALIVTSQNKHTGELINKLRLKNDKKPLALIEVSLVDAKNFKPISSTRIRSGEIDRVGNLVMPDNMRKELSVPLGPVLTIFARSHLANGARTIYTVGDLTTKTVLDAGIIPDMAIIDNKVNRKVYTGLSDWKKNTVKVKSGPGYISQEAIEAIRSKPRIIEVDGEEDLLVLPVIVEAPLGSMVYYGQPGVGMVEVVVTELVKKQAIEYLARFTS